MIKQLRIRIISDITTQITTWIPIGKWPALKHLAQAIPAGCTRQGMAKAPGRCRSPSMHHAPRTLDSTVGNPRSRSMYHAPRTPDGIAKAPRSRSMHPAARTLDGTVENTVIHSPVRLNQ
jgi:hypothetical protein